MSRLCHAATSTLTQRSSYDLPSNGTMRGGFYVPGHNRVVLQDTPIPTPSSKQVLLKVAAAGVCHTDVFFLSASTSDPRTFIMGHESAGYAVSWGSEVSGIDKDQLYVVYIYSSCVQRSHPSLSPAIGVGLNGGYAPYVVVDANQLVPVPKGLSPEVACLSTDSLLTAYNAVHHVAGLRPGTNKRILIYGVGGLGHQALQLTKSYGATVYACDFKPEARELASSLGAEQVFDVAQLHAAIADDVKDPLVIDIAIDFVANAQSFSLLCSAVKRTGTGFNNSGGVIVLVGVSTDQLVFNTAEFVTNQINIKPTFYGSLSDCKACLDLLAEGVVKPVVTTEPLSKVVDVLDELKASEYIGRKVLLPSDEGTD